MIIICSSYIALFLAEASSNSIIHYSVCTYHRIRWGFFKYVISCFQVTTPKPVSYPAIIANFNVHCLGIKAKRNEVVIGDLVTMSLSPYGTRTPSLQSQASCHQDEDAGLVTQKKVHGDTGQFLFCLERQITTWGSVCTKSLSSRISTLNSQKKVWYSI